MPKYILTGDIRHPGRIAVTASTHAEAIEKAAAGHFTVYDESSKDLAFDWCEDETSTEIVEE